MDLKKFKETEKPEQRRSQLAPYKAEILDLETNGYTLKQIQKFLKANGLTISIEAISKFLRKHKDDLTATTSPARGEHSETQRKGYSASPVDKTTEEALPNTPAQTAPGELPPMTEMDKRLEAAKKAVPNPDRGLARLASQAKGTDKKT